MLRTKNVAITGALVAGVLIAGGLTANQYQLQNRLNSIEKNPVKVIKVIAVPSASPSATITPTYILKSVPSLVPTKRTL